MSNNHFSRKERQLKNHILKLDNLIKKSRGLLTKEINNLIFKIKELISLLREVTSIKKLKYIIGSFAFLFGISSYEVKAQSFAAPVQNPFGLNFLSNLTTTYGTSLYYTGKVQFADMDNDGDLDLLYSSFDVDTGYYSYYTQPVFIYHENIGNVVNPQFSNAVKNPFNLSSPQNFSLYGSVFSHNLVDIDNDGDLDIIASFTGIYQTYTYYTGYTADFNTIFKFYENIGNSTIPLFSTQQNNPFGLISDSVLTISDLVDIDGDGDFDIISSIAEVNPSYSYYSSYINHLPAEFIENIGSTTNPQFTSSQINQQLGVTIPSGEYPRFLSFGDIDGDGDYDLLTSDYTNGPGYGWSSDFKYQQNKGSSTNPLLSLEATNPFGLSSIQEDYCLTANSELVDLDGDGDMDIISTAIAFPDGMIDDFKFHYYENNSGPTNTTNLSEKFNLYPNPSSDIINIASNYNIKLIEVIDKLGRIILKKEYSNSLIINSLSDGVYSVNIYFEDKKITKKFTKL